MKPTQNTRHRTSARLVQVLLVVLVAVGCADDGGDVSGTPGPREESSAGSTGVPAHERGPSGGTTSLSANGRESRGRTSEEVGRLSIREMVGQMFVVSVSGTESDYYIEKMIRERNVGGVLLFGYNMEGEAQTKSLVGSLQELARETKPFMPLFVAVDQEGGEVSSAPWVTPQPAASEVGARGNAEEARSIAKHTGRELQRAGVNTNFAPVVDTGFGAAIGPRAYGDDPSVVSRMGVASVEGYRKAGLVTSAKHFPNHGVADADSHTGLPVVEHDTETISSYDLPPFRAAVDAGVPMVMVGHLIYPAIDPSLPTSLSPAAMKLLRDDLGFEGVIVTDDLSMDAASRGRPPADAAAAAVTAGADLLILSGPAQQQADAYEAVVAAVESGEVPEEQIERSVERIVKTKKDYLSYDPSAN